MTAQLTTTDSILSTPHIGTPRAARAGRPAASPAHGARATRTARAIAHWLDNRFLDPLIGLFLPGLGDLLTSGFGIYIVSLAARRGLPGVVIARMLLNLAIDAAIGAIPLFGDVFDIVFRANQRNLALLEQRYESGGSTVSDWLVIGGAALAFTAALVIPIYLIVTVIVTLTDGPL